MKKWRVFLTVFVISLSLMLIAANVFQVAPPPLLKEPWNTLLFAVLFPVLIQLYKVYQDKGGKTPSKRFLQMTSLIISLVFVFANGGFVGIAIPAFPAMGEDIVIFLGDIIDYARELVVVVGLAFGSQMGLYEFVLKRIFETVGLAAPDKVASRARVGFLA